METANLFTNSTRAGPLHSSASGSSDTETTGDMIKRVSRGLTSEMVAGVAKLMGNLDLIYGAKKIHNPTHCNTTLGLPGTFSSRLQPNHTLMIRRVSWLPLLEGLSYGCGDAVIGLNPVDDSVESVARILKSFDEFKNKWEVPTQICVLAHVTTQTEAADKLNGTDRPDVPVYRWFSEG